MNTTCKTSTARAFAAAYFIVAMVLALIGAVALAYQENELCIGAMVIAIAFALGSAYLLFFVR